MERYGHIQGQGEWIYNFGFNDGEGIQCRVRLGGISPEVAAWDVSVSLIKTTDNRIGYLVVESPHGTGHARFAAIEGEESDLLNKLLELKLRETAPEHTSA